MIILLQRYMLDYVYQEYNIKYIKLKLQKNGSDCGVYAISYLKYFLQNQPIINLDIIENHLQKWSNDYNLYENPEDMRKELINVIDNLRD